MSHKTLQNALQLQQAGFIAPNQVGAIEAVSERFAVAVPPLLASLIRGQDDPIARQVIPSTEELKTAKDEEGDPIGDHNFSPMEGLIHRYEDRVLVKPLLICPLYCRFCFRREQVGHLDNAVLGQKAWENIIHYLRAHREVREVILSGGDPLMLSARRLGQIFADIETIEHIKLIRLHTRVPIATPARVTSELLGVLEGTSKTVWMAIHTNYKKEFSPPACRAFKQLVSAGVALVGQSVLLRGVNDSVEALEALFCLMLENRIRPYYLHQLDKAPGTSHFHVPVQRGLEIMRGLRGRITGLAWPIYVYDIPGGYGKVPLGPDYLKGHKDVRDPKGQWHHIDRI